MTRSRKRTCIDSGRQLAGSRSLSQLVGHVLAPLFPATDAALLLSREDWPPISRSFP